MAKITANSEIKRCEWVKPPELYIRYHDEVWGVPIHDDSLHFEWLSLEIAQAGLSMLTIIKKRANFQQAFANFNIEQVAQFDQDKRQILYQDTGIIRNKRKIDAIIHNAACFLAIQKAWHSFDRYIWHFVDNKPIINHWKHYKDAPGHTELAQQITKDLKRHGFQFVGSTIVYAYMQAAGLVNDHTVDCFRHQALAK